MYSIRFYLLKPSESNSSLFVSVKWPGCRVRVSLGVSIKTSHWDSKRGKIKPGAANARAVITRCGRIEDFIQDYFNQRDIPDEEELKRLLKDEVHPALKERRMENILQALERFIQERGEGRELNPRSGRPYAKGSLDNYDHLRKTIIDFADFKEMKVDFASINQDWLSKFHSFLSTEKSLTDNGTHKQFVLLKSFLKVMKKEKGKEVPDIRDYKTYTHQNDYPFLDEEEIQKIIDAKIENKKLQQARDTLVFLCNTGLRYSDYLKLSPTNFDMKKRMIHLEVKKTRQRVSIPLLPQSLAIAEKYNCELPKLNHSVVNNYIRQVCREAGIDSDFEYIEYKQGEPEEMVVPKWEMITSHTGRRSFCTNLLTKGISPQVVMKISGHKSLSSFEKYFKLSSLQAAEQVQAILSAGLDK